MPVWTFAVPAVVCDPSLYPAGTERTADIDEIPARELQLSHATDSDFLRKITIKDQRIGSSMGFHRENVTQRPVITRPILLHVILAVMSSTRAFLLCNHAFDRLGPIQLFTDIAWI